MAWHTVGITSDDGQTLGTGTALSCGTHFAILTAWHVIKKCKPASLQFFFRPNKPLERRIERKPPPASTMGISQKVKVKRMIKSVHLDLALLHVQGTLEGEYPVRFFAGIESARRPHVGEIVTYLGFPQQLVTRISRNELAVSQSIFWNRVLPNMLLPRFTPENSYMVGFNPDDLDADGLSGAGVWIVEGTGPLWFAKLSFCGIVTHFYRQSRVLSVLDGQSVRAFISKHWNIAHQTFTKQSPQPPLHD